MKKYIVNDIFRDFLMIRIPKNEVFAEHLFHSFQRELLKIIRSCTEQGRRFIDTKLDDNSIILIKDVKEEYLQLIVYSF